MLHFNTPEGSKERQRTKPLTLHQEEEVVAIINDLMAPGYKPRMAKAKGELLQRFINHYQNLSHHKAITCGLWATDMPDKISDPEKLLFEITF